MKYGLKGISQSFFNARLHDQTVDHNLDIVLDILFQPDRL